MSNREECHYEGSDQELFSEREESDYEELPVRTYREYKMSGDMAKRVVLQTSDSSDDDENQHNTQPSVSFYTKARKDAAAKARPPLAALVPQNSENVSRQAPPQPKRMKPTAGVKNMKQVFRPTNQISTIPSSNKSSERHATESHAHATGENHTLKELKKTNELLVQLVDRMKKTERRVRNLEDKIVTTSSPSSSSASTPKRSKSRCKAVPPEVRSETRRVYTILCDECEEFEGWKIGPGCTYKDPENRAVLDCLLREVKALNPSYITEHIKDAAYRFYRTRCEEASVSRRGKASQKLTTKRRHERLTRKFNERKTALEKMSFTNNDELEKWQQVLKMEYMSSEESGIDDENEVIILKSLPWRSVHVGQMFRRLDDKTLGEKSPQARRQMKRRVTGETSSRPRPTGDLPPWAVTGN